MHDPPYVGAKPVNQQVHRDFAGDIAGTRKPAAFPIDHHHIRCPQHALAHARGSNHNPLVIETNGKIAVGGCDVAALVQHLAEEHHFASILPFARH